MNFIKFLFILYSCSVSTARSGQLQIFDESEDACGEFTVGKCDPEAEVLLSVQHIPCTGSGQETSVCWAACQRICSITAGCNYFTYGASEDCYLMNQDVHNGYLASCAIVAGPSTPSLAECDAETPTDSCLLFVSEDCNYTGEVVYTSKDVVSAADCQDLLLEIGFLYGGEMFVHDASQQNLCEFRSSSTKECSGVNGPVAPSIADCFSTSTYRK